MTAKVLGMTAEVLGMTGPPCHPEERSDEGSDATMKEKYS